MREPVLRVLGVSKAYGGVQALRDVSVDFYRQEIHAVLGENGAGKSTLMGVLAGFVVPDSGRAELRGEGLAFGRPFETRARGVRMVHQHFMLVPNFSVDENLALAQLEGWAGRLDLGGLSSRGKEEGRRLGWVLEGSRRTGSLPVGSQQRVEILKALAGESDVLILDEPTAVLSPDEVEELFQVLCGLRAQGKAIILIAHKLSEVLAVADRVTVLRRGAKVAEALARETSAEELAGWMVGDVPELMRRGEGVLGAVRVRASGLVVLGDRGERAVDGLDLDVRSGEVLGIGGVDGNGQVELAEALAGVRAVSGGVLEVDGPVGYVPQDRHSDGLALGMTVEENFLVSGVPGEFVRGGFLRRGAIRAWAAGLVREYGVKIGRLGDPVKSLSGGNQQKVVVGRVLSRGPGVVVAVNPTRGLDIRATDFVHSRLLAAARGGAAVVLISTDLDELAALSDRSVYLNRGRLSSSLVGSVGGSVGAAP